MSTTHDAHPERGPSHSASSEGNGRELVFEAPGPGTWELDLDHQSAPHGALQADLFPEVFTEGFRHTFRVYGLPLETLEAEMLHGWAYTRAKVAGAPDKGGAPPPDLVLKVVTRLHPEMRRRNRAAKRAIADKRWLVDAATWDDERSRHEARAAELAAAVRDQPDRLRETLGAAIDAASVVGRRHFELVGSAVAIGRLLTAGEDWELDTARLVQVFQGYSPATAGTIEPLRAMAEQVHASGQQPTTLLELRAISPALDRSVDSFLARWGSQVLGADVSDAKLSDYPDRLVELVMAASASTGGRDLTTSPDTSDDVVRELRRQVPEPDRARFEELVAEARIVYASLESHSGLFTRLMGVLSDVVAAVGADAVKNGALENADDVWNLDRRELLALAEGDAVVDGAELARRRAHRAAATAATPPPHLGDEPSPPPDAALFPSPMAGMVRSFGAFLASKFTERRPIDPAVASSGRLRVDGETIATGQLIGTPGVTGRLVVADQVADAIERVRAGDILVCRYTTAAWNSIFPLLGGIVTEAGGVLGHTAIMAREFDIPALVGVDGVDPVWDGVTASI